MKKRREPLWMIQLTYLMSRINFSMVLVIVVALMLLAEMKL
jgi:hypothetical protein